MTSQKKTVTRLRCSRDETVAVGEPHRAQNSNAFAL
jgi:hypothetical protein